MPLYRVTGIHASSHSDRELFVDASSPEAAINTARRRSILAPAVQVVEGGVAPPGSAVIIKPAPIAARDRPVRSIVCAVVFGALMLAVMISVLLGLLRTFVPAPPA